MKIRVDYWFESEGGGFIHEYSLNESVSPAHFTDSTRNVSGFNFNTYDLGETRYYPRSRLIRMIAKKVES